ncbi:MAG: molybdopterin converting factor subunit 1 [Anaerolineae bacterium]|nr:molybdopterin converting factor subunit 1 [Anaerolineae bacterium]
MLNVTVLLFATLKDHAGTSRLALTLPGDAAALRDVRVALAGAQPALAQYLPTAVAAINQDFAFDDSPVQDGDEVAFFPPVSGGAPGWPEVCRVAHEPIRLDEITRAVTTPETGAVCIFSGAVRGETRGKDADQAVHTAWLEYEAYEPMALAKMRQVVAEIREKWPLVQGVAVVQRVGRLEVSEPTVLIACAAAHRDQGCFEAARYGIDRLKQIVPVWKKEIGPDGASWVEGDYHPAPDDRQA